MRRAVYKRGNFAPEQRAIAYKMKESFSNKNRILLILLLIFLGWLTHFLNEGNGAAGLTIATLIKEQMRLYPKMENQDLYKFLHQAAMGSEHAVRNYNEVKKWIEKESASLDWSRKNGLIEFLSPDKRLGRINLRPYLKSGFSKDELLKAFVNTANNYKGSLSLLRSYLNEAVQMAKRGEINLPADKLEVFFAEQAAKGYPAVHHSQKYNAEYKPAYRVVLLEEVKFHLN